MHHTKNILLSDTAAQLLKQKPLKESLVYVFKCKPHKYLLPILDFSIIHDI